MNEKVSVVIPLFNGEEDILDTIESVRKQTYPNIEIIVVDDGSTDSSHDLLYPYIKNEMIKYFHQENQGVSAARNRGIREATGTYIAFLDKDDLWLPDKLNRQMKAIRNSGAEAAYCGFIDWYKEKDEKHKRKSIFKTGSVLNQYLQNKIYIQTSTLIIKKEVIIKHDLMFTTGESWGEDLEFFVKVLHSCKIAGVPAYDVLYKKDSTNSLSSQNVSLEKNLKAVDMWHRLRAWLIDNGASAKSIEIIDGYRLPQVIVTIFLHANEQEATRIYREKYQAIVAKQQFVNGLRSIKCYLQTRKLNNR
ncbi:glycosyltransferase family 2 protein [Metabacillus idriensis]|uniref:glycosyltransferase family 2 protein n=1 Tax=Metabacillus idriensis TaxID=324768 RepID=UPI00174924E7|nr:glycosyltransferase family 2 protein [Metabacillus idriensis]